MSRLVLGIDPGFASCGWCIADLDTRVVHSMGVITTKKADKKLKVRAVDDNLERTKQITKVLDNLIKWGCTVEIQGRGVGPLFSAEVTACSRVYAEAMSFPRDASVAGKMNLCWGALIATAYARSVGITQNTPQEIKKKVTGAPDASKRRVELTLKRLWKNTRGKLKGVPKRMHEHAWDALAAITASIDPHLRLL